MILPAANLVHKAKYISTLQAIMPKHMYYKFYKPYCNNVDPIMQILCYNTGVER